MTISVLKEFFLICSAINIGLLLLWTLCFFLIPGTVYRLQAKFCPMTEKQFQLIFYGFLGVFKILVLIFNVIPWIALCLMDKG